MLCKNCGAQLDDDALFCPKCGASVEIEHADSLGIKEDIPDESAQQKKQNKAISDTGKTFDVAPSVDELEKQKRTTKMMASCAVITLIVACLFIFIGNPTLKTNKSSKNQNIEEPSQIEETVSNNATSSDDQVPVQEKQDDNPTFSSVVVEDYISNLTEIPSDYMDKLKAQASDNITAYAASNWNDNVSKVDSEYIGSYLLRKKDGISAKHENILYVVYAVTAEIEKDSGNNHVVTDLFYTAFFDLKKSDTGNIETDIGDYEIPKNTFNVSVTNNGKEEKYGFVGYETVDDMYKDLVLKNVDQYSCDGDVAYEAVVTSVAESINEEFGIDPNTVEDYSANLNKDYFGYFDSGIVDFSFRYPLNIYNNVTRDVEPFETDYGTNEVTYTFTGSKGSRLVYSLINRNDSRSIRDMSKYVYSNETNILIDSADIVNSVTSDHGKVIVTGWEDVSKEFIIYDLLKIEDDYVLQMKVYMTNFTDENDKNEKSYVTECDYRYCGFSDSKYSARTYEEYLEAN